VSGSGAPEYQQQSRTCNRMPCVPVDRILNRMRVSFDQDIHRHLPHGCVMEHGPRAVRDTQRQTTHVHDTCSTHLKLKRSSLGRPLCCGCPVSRLTRIRHSPVLTNRYPASSKLETESHSHSHHRLPIPYRIANAGH